MRSFRGGTARSSDEVLEKGMERRGCAIEPNSTVNPKGEEPMNEAKPFLISKREVWEAYQRVKANKGAAGIDEQSIAEFVDCSMSPEPVRPNISWRVTAKQ
jgi:RNA-directed DNA polymerase